MEPGLVLVTQRHLGFDGGAHFGGKHEKTVKSPIVTCGAVLVILVMFPFIASAVPTGSFSLQTIKNAPQKRRFRCFSPLGGAFCHFLRPSCVQNRGSVLQIVCKRCPKIPPQELPISTDGSGWKRREPGEPHRSRVPLGFFGCRRRGNSVNHKIAAEPRSQNRIWRPRRHGRGLLVL